MRNVAKLPGKAEPLFQLPKGSDGENELDYGVDKLWWVIVGGNWNLIFDLSKYFSPIKELVWPMTPLVKNDVTLSFCQVFRDDRSTIAIFVSNTFGCSTLFDRALLAHCLFLVIR